VSRLSVFVLIALLAIVGPSPVGALSWQTSSFVYANEKPTGPNSSKVEARGQHRLTIDTDPGDSGNAYIVRNGTELLQDSDEMDDCETPQQGYPATTYHSCTTEYTQDPCEDASWTAVTKAWINGSTDTDASDPKDVTCTCT